VTTSAYRWTHIAGLTVLILANEALLMVSGWNSEVADRFGIGERPDEKLDDFSINGKSFPLTQPLRVPEGDVLHLRLFGAGTDGVFHLHGHGILVAHKGSSTSVPWSL